MDRGPDGGFRQNTDILGGRRFQNVDNTNTTNNTLSHGPLETSLLNKYIQLIAVATIASIGIPLNIMCIRVLRKRAKRQPAIYRIFTGLIVMATINVFSLLLISSKHIIIEYFQFWHVSIIIIQIYIRMFFDKSLSALVILISLNRLIVLYKPLESRDYFIVKSVGKVAIGLVITISLLIIPTALGGSPTGAYSGQASRTFADHYTTALTIVFNIILWVVQIVFNVLLVVRYGKAVRQSKALTASTSLENAHTLQIGAAIGMSTIYLLNVTPQSILETIGLFNVNRFGDHAGVINDARIISSIMNAFSAACYGPLHLCTSKENRNAMLYMVPCCNPERNVPTLSSGIFCNKPVTETYLH